MKKIILSLLAVSFLFSFSACRKYVTVPVASIDGAWTLYDASQNSGSGWHYFHSGLENGVFDFYDNGSATFDDGYNFMQGSFYITTVISGYYDQYGNYYNDAHDTFELHVFDSRTKGSIDLFFDDVMITGSSIIGTVYSGNTISRYVFRRS